MSPNRSSKMLRSVCATILFLVPTAAVHAGEPLSINWYHEQEYLQPVIDAFTADTGIAVRVTSDYDTFTTDVIFVSDYKGLTEAKHFGKFRKLEPAFFAQMASIVPSQWRDEDGTWLGVVLRVRTAVINNKLVRADQRPKTLLDLADPKWRGKMTIRSAANVYNRSLLAYMLYRHGEEAATRWAQGIVRNFGSASGYRGDTANALAVAHGTHAISFINTYYLGYLQGWHADEPAVLKALSKDLDVVWLDGGPHGLPVNVTGVGISSALEEGSEKLAQAQKLIAFLLSKKGQALMSAHVFKYPVRRDVEASEYLRRFGSFKLDAFNLNELRYLYDDADRIMKKAGWNAER